MIQKNQKKYKNYYTYNKHDSDFYTCHKNKKKCSTSKLNVKNI